ncbi:MAG: hypothetical protein ACM3Q1_02670 [Bacteroidales bacterium]
MQAFSSNGINYQFRIVSGTVLGTDQRSDTRVWGSGSTTIIDGQGSGHTTIDSRVDVVRDLWLKDAQGQEHHYRFNTDIPFREGQDVHCVHLNGRDLAEKKAFDVVYSVYNASVDRYWTLCDVKSLIKAPQSMGASHLVWGVILTPVFGIGLLFFIDYVYAKMKGAVPPKEAKQIQDRVALDIDGQHKALIGELHRTKKLPEPEAAATTA